MMSFPVFYCCLNVLTVSLSQYGKKNIRKCIEDIRFPVIPFFPGHSFLHVKLTNIPHAAKLVLQRTSGSVG